MPTAVITLWSREPIYESPARKTFNVNWDGDLVRADVTIDVDPNFALVLPFTRATYIRKIVLNGTEVNWVGDPNDVVTFDARPYLRKGANYIEIHHNWPSVPGIQTAGVYAYVVIESTGPVGGNVAPSDGGGISIPISGIPDWVWIFGLILLIILVIAR
jgi:hypothetical protein